MRGFVSFGFYLLVDNDNVMPSLVTGLNLYH
jgi:hypothetical protein